MTGIAWNHLSDLQQAQLLKFRPDLQFQADLAMGLIPRCPRHGCGGPIVKDDSEMKCLLCERIFEENGNEIMPRVAIDTNVTRGERLPDIRHIR